MGINRTRMAATRRHSEGMISTIQDLPPASLSVHLLARVVIPLVHGAESFVQKLHRCPFNVTVYSMLVGGSDLK